MWISSSGGQSSAGHVLLSCTSHFINRSCNIKKVPFNLNVHSRINDKVNNNSKTNHNLWTKSYKFVPIYCDARTLMKMLLYESVSCVCLCLSDESVLFSIYLWFFLNCLHAWMAQGKIRCKLTGSPSLNKVFALNWISFCLHYNVFVWRSYFSRVSCTLILTNKIDVRHLDKTS